MRRPLNILCLVNVPALLLGAHAGPPVQSGAPQSGVSSCGTAPNPSTTSGGTCPTGYTCARAATGSGISQRRITGAQGLAYLQTIETESSAAASAPAGFVVVVVLFVSG